jgi:hypothetical protein
MKYDVWEDELNRGNIVEEFPPVGPGGIFNKPAKNEFCKGWR